MLKQKDKKQKIELTRKQFKALLKAVYLGNWMANAYRTSDKVEEYESIEDYIFSLCPQFGFDKYVDHEILDDGHYYPTGYFEDSTNVHELHDEYDENTFWDELADRLGERDFFEKYTKEEIEAMDEEEWYEKLHQCIHRYHEEFEKCGVQNVRLERN